jgi:citrate synthase
MWYSWVSDLYCRLANQEVLRWQLAMQAELGDKISHEDIKAYLWKTLKSGQVVPGYGHGVLRNPDPRFIALQEFCQEHPELKESSIVQLVQRVRLEPWHSRPDR